MKTICIIALCALLVVGAVAPPGAATGGRNVENTEVLEQEGVTLTPDSGETDPLVSLDPDCTGLTSEDPDYWALNCDDCENLALHSVAWYAAECEKDPDAEAARRGVARVLELDPTICGNVKFTLQATGPWFIDGVARSKQYPEGILAEKSEVIELDVRPSGRGTWSAVPYSAPIEKRGKATGASVPINGPGKYRMAVSGTTTHIVLTPDRAALKYRSSLLFGGLRTCSGQTCGFSSPSDDACNPQG